MRQVGEEEDEDEEEMMDMEEDEEEDEEEDCVELWESGRMPADMAAAPLARAAFEARSKTAEQIC